MRTAQHVIKWLAVGLGIMIIVGMVTAVAGVGAIVTGVFGGWSSDTGQVDEDWSETVVSEDAQLRTLTVKVNAVNVRLEVGERFEIKADEEWIGFRRSGDQVYVEEREHGWWKTWGAWNGPERREMTIIVPEGLELVNLNLDAGAGAVRIEGLKTERADLKLGAGRVEIVNLTVAEQTKISSGAGYLLVRDSSLMNLDFDMGVGKVELGTELLGKTEIDAGVGRLDLDLVDTRDGYRMEIAKGLGSVTVNGATMDDDAAYGEGKNLIKIEGGVGAIEVHL